MNETRWKSAATDWEKQQVTVPKFDITVSATEIDAALERTAKPRHRHLLLNMREHLLLEASGEWPEVLKPRLMVENPSFKLYTPNGRVIIEGMPAVEKFYRDYWESEPTRSGFATLMPEGEPGTQISVTDQRVIGVSLLANQRWGHELESMSRGRAVATGAGSIPDLDPDGLYLETYHMVFSFEYGSGDRLIGENTYSGGDSTVYRLSTDDLVTTEDAARMVAPFLANPPPATI